MAVYFDASAFFPLFIDDLFSSAATARLEEIDAGYAISDLTLIETSSAASRAVRARRLPEDKARTALDSARRWVDAKAKRYEVLRTDFILADEYVRRFDLGLRAPDALHVAICRRLGVTLVTCDLAQGRAARGLGIETLELSGDSS